MPIGPAMRCKKPIVANTRFHKCTHYPSIELYAASGGLRQKKITPGLAQVKTTPIFAFNQMVKPNG
jgi:hypothetical protein